MTAREKSNSLEQALSLAMVVCVVSTLAMAGAADPVRTIYVDAAAGGSHDGSSWIDAYGYLQDALADANNAQQPVEIRVAQGIYRPDQSAAHPDGTADREATFYLPDNVVISGGFAGVSAAEPNARDIVLHETILSGDLAGDDIAVIDPCDLLTESARAENSYHIVTAVSCSRSAVLDGLTIASGNAIGPGRHVEDGGGLYLPSPCCPSIRNCTFMCNSADTGGAVYVGRAGPEFVNCAFLRNAALSGGATGTVLLRSGGFGDCRFIVRRCVFVDNYAQNSGGAVCIALGAPSVIEGCTFVRNVAATGGAMFVYMFVDDTASIANCRFICNKAGEAGGVVCFRGRGPDMALCTLFANVAPTGRAVACLGPWYEGWDVPSATITSAILWDGGDEIAVIEQTQMNVAYSNVQGGWPGEGNIDVAPLFTDPGYWDANPGAPGPDDPNDDFWTDGDYHLKSQAGRWDPVSEGWVIDEVTSPCLDAGDPYSPIGLEPFPNGGRINMGVYGGTAEASKSYFGAPLCETVIGGDINGDCKVDFTDLMILVDHWHEDVIQE